MLRLFNKSPHWNVNYVPIMQKYWIFCGLGGFLLKMKVFYFKANLFWAKMSKICLNLLHKKSSNGRGHIHSLYFIRRYDFGMSLSLLIYFWFWALNLLNSFLFFPVLSLNLHGKKFYCTSFNKTTKIVELTGFQLMFLSL